MRHVQFFMLILMLHFIADFALQGWFANAKQQQWWKDQCDKHGYDFSQYKYDWVCALLGHSMYWTLVTFSPIIFFAVWPSIVSLALFIGLNVAVHAITDHLKANKLKINLIQDQAVHLIQIGISTCYFAHLGLM